MRNTIPENEKATAPVPAVGAAGEQSIINKTTDSIAENSRERNLRTAGDEADREEARQQYLDSAGIQRNFRW